MKKITAFFFAFMTASLLNLISIQAQEALLTQNFFNAVLCADGTIQACGQNNSGQLGQGTTGPDEHFFIAIPSLSNIVQISVGGDHMIALHADGTVWAWGKNDDGQLGLGFISVNEATPTQIPTLTNVVQIQASAFHSMARLSDGTVWAWGDNFWGQLGNGTTTNSSTPVQVLGISNAVDIALQTTSSMALLNDGTVRCWGSGSSGNLGNGSTLPINSSPVTAIGITNAVNISGGDKQGYAILSDGTAMAWGQNIVGELGIGTTGGTSTPTAIVGLNNIADIASGDGFAMALLDDGTLQVWGSGSLSGFCGVGVPDSNVPIAGPALPLISGIQACPTGKNAVVLLDDGSVRIWGLNVTGQVGVGNTDYQCSPQTPIGVCAVGDYCDLVYSNDVENEQDLNCCLDVTNFTATPTTPLAEVGTVAGRPAYIVAANATWTPTANPFVTAGLALPGTALYLDLDLVIPAGIVLNLYELTIHFSPRSRVLVQQGGQLHIGGVSDDPTVLRGLCQTVWQGVQVEGPGEGNVRADTAPFPYNYGVFSNTSAATILDAIIGVAAMQLPLMSTNDLAISSLPNFIPPNNGTTLVPTLTSVYLADYVNDPLAHNTAGGVVITVDMIHFVNCFLGINLSWYDNLQSLGEHVTQLNGGRFLTDGLAYPFSVLSPNTLRSEAGIMLRDYHFLNIGGTTTADNQFENHKYGIRAVEATRLHIGSNSFNHCEIGLSIFNGFGSAFDDVILIDYNTFEDSEVAIQCSGVGGLDIEHNTINALTPLSANNNIGIFMRASAFDIVDNDINSVILGSVLVSNITAGSILHENTYNNSLIGIWAYGNNTPDVQLSCNAFNFYLTALLVDDFTHPTLPALSEAGIFSDQGVCMGGGGGLDRIAGNAFNPATTFIPDIISNIAFPFIYYTDFTAPFLPTVNNPALVILQGCATAGVFNCEIGGILSDTEILNLVDEAYLNSEAVKKMRFYVESDDKAAAVSLLNSIANDNAKRLLIPYYIEEGDFVVAQSLLDDLPQNSPEEQNYYSLYTIYKNVYESGRNIWEMTAAEELVVRNIANSGTATTFDAQAVLYLAYGEEFPIELPALPTFLETEIQQQLTITFKTDHLADVDKCKIYPNPTQNYLLIEHNLGVDETATFLLYDTQGQLLQQQPISGQGNEQLSLTDVSAGMYYYKIVHENGHSLQQDKIIVIK